MKLEFIDSIQEDELYKGIIQSYEATDEWFYVHVVLDDEPDTSYLNRQKISRRKGSPFYQFCSDFGLIRRTGKVRLDDLINTEVWAEFKKGKDGNMYICHLEPATEEGEEYDDSEED